MDDPNGVVGQIAGPALGIAKSQPDPIQAKLGLSKSTQLDRIDFMTDAAIQKTGRFASLVKEVDFPAFVNGLINGVFQAIVDTSIEQMRAYAELVANVAKSAEDFMNDNIGLGQGRDY